MVAEFSTFSSLFLSTPSARRATILFTEPVHTAVVISIHALREEGDRWSALSAARKTISIHALREEGDYRFTDLVSEYVKFLSTPSARRATPDVCRHSSYVVYFYPRPPRGGRQIYHALHDSTNKISIHALREEGDSKNREKTPCFCLIIHLSAQIAKRCLQTKPQNHTVTCANGRFSGAKRPGKPCVLPVRTGRTSKDQHAVLGKLRV